MTPKLLPAFPNYAVSPDGRIFKVSGLVRGRAVSEPMEMKAQLHSNGYMAIEVREGGRRVRVFLHQATATAFCPRGSADSEVRHLDGSRINNHFSNLAWGTRRENAQDMVLHGRSTRGEKNSKAKLSATQVAEIRELELPHKVLAQRYGVSKGTIGFIKRGETWKHI